MLLPRVLWLGEVSYLHSLCWMQNFTAIRLQQTQDEFWSLTHRPVYTQGTSCTTVPAVSHQHIPTLKSDRGGQITYHGQGQLIVYLLIDIKRLGIGPKRLVKLIEQAVIELLNQYNINAESSPGAPGVYVAGKKIAALGLRIKNGKTYHGLSFNIDMDLTAFEAIDPCGYKGLEVTQLSKFGVNAGFHTIRNQLIDCLIDCIYCRTFED